MTKILALGGLALAFLAFVISDVVNRGYSPVDETISRYVNEPHGWLVTAGLLAMTAGSAAVALRTGGNGGRLLWIWTGCLLIAAIFPADPPGNWDSPSLSDSVHGTAAWLGFIALQIAIVRLTVVWRRDPAWTSTKRGLTVLACVSTAVFVLFAVAMVDEVAITHTAPLGLAERALVAVNLVWLALTMTPTKPKLKPSGTMSAMATSESK